MDSVTGYWRSQSGFELSRINEATHGNVGKASNYTTVLHGGETTLMTWPFKKKASKKVKVRPMKCVLCQDDAPSCCQMKPEHTGNREAVRPRASAFSLCS